MKTAGDGKILAPEMRHLLQPDILGATGLPGRSTNIKNFIKQQPTRKARSIAESHTHTI